ncbi:Inactive beta-amylase 9 [Nymphaea thermarum]|nr:Inactive beta-amylase 9 [Nymphaea thermarum]
MEVSVIGSSQVPVGRKNQVLPKSDIVGRCRELGFLKGTTSRDGFGLGLTADLRRRRKVGVPVVAASGAGKVLVGKEGARRSQEKKSGRVPLYVALPLDAVSDNTTLNHTKAIATGLKALKLLGVTGVSLPVWWGIVENEEAGKYNWSAYQSLAEIIRNAGLKLRVSICFHATSNISLPPWVIKIGESDPDIFFKDRAGKRYNNCLSLAADDLPVLAGRSPMQVYEQFLSEFKSSFSGFLGGTITDISVSLGPNGELRYPSFPESSRSKIQGVGEFQCYDKYMLANLKQHAESSGKRDWGHSGPHDAPSYHHWPQTNNFFKDSNGSWETEYGNFFLNWYSGQLTAHGDRVLSLASRVFCDCPVTISGKVPLVYSWYKTRSHAAELTAGLYNTDKRNGYDAIARMFAANSATLVLPGMDLSDAHRPAEALASPESVISQIKAACMENGVPIAGENTPASSVPDNFTRIKENLKDGRSCLEAFNYYRMGAHFFSPEHWPKFTEFFRGLELPEKDSDDLPDKEGSLSFTNAGAAAAEPEKTLQMQA